MIAFLKSDHPNESGAGDPYGGGGVVKSARSSHDRIRPNAVARSTRTGRP
jgi:hypothetical protein